MPVVDGACRSVHVPRAAVGSDGRLADPDLVEQLRASLTALAQAVTSQTAS
ncbi:MAG: hypothetical protein JWM64_2603 [Frankiales bacterium]|nr:hypothetical protein [Frankiales bacterium]